LDFDQVRDRNRSLDFRKIDSLAYAIFRGKHAKFLYSRAASTEHASAESKYNSPMVWTHLGLTICAQGRRTAKQIAGWKIHCDQVRALFPVVFILANTVPLVKRPCL